MQDDVMKILAIEEIKQLKSRYFQALDGADWAAYAATFTSDARLDLNDNNRIFATYGFPMQDTTALVGGTQIAAYVRDALVDSTTVHQGHMPDLTLLSSDRAKGVWALADIIESPHSILRGYGHYHEQYRRVDGDWRIESLQLSRLRMEFYVPDGEGGWRQLRPES